jgi:excisionase family DNA binding protein
MTTQPELDLWSTDGTVGRALVTVKDAGRILAISRSSVYELIATHELETVHIGRSVRIPLDAIASYIETLRSGGAEGSSHADVALRRVRSR